MKYLPEMKRFRVKAKKDYRKLSDTLAAKSITAEDLIIILECLELKTEITKGVRFMDGATEKEFAGILKAMEKFADAANKKAAKKISAITPKADLAIRIKKAMAGKEFSQRKLAARMGMSVPSLNHKINGEKEFTLAEAFFLADILQAPFDDLFFKFPY